MPIGRASLLSLLFFWNFNQLLGLIFSTIFVFCLTQIPLEVFQKKVLYILKGYRYIEWDMKTGKEKLNEGSRRLSPV